MDHVIDTLWISDIQTVQQKPTHRFDAIITICQDTVADNVGCEYHHFPLSDGPPIEDSYNPGVFEYDLFETAVDTIIEHAEAGDTTLVHCHAGQSRSVMALATALTVLCDKTYNDSIGTIVRARSKPISPDGDVEQFAHRYITEHTASETQS